MLALAGGVEMSESLWRMRLYRTGVAVNRMGQVFRLDGRTGEWRQDIGRPDPTGHLYISVGNTKFYIHRMVAELYLDPPDFGHGETPNAHHKNENKRDNRAENLEWISHADHTSHHKAGVNNPQAKLTQEKADDIRRLRKIGISVKKLAAHFDVSESTIYRILKGELWQRAEEPKDESSEEKNGQSQS